MRTQRALLSAAWLILGLLLTAGESPSGRIVSKYSSTAREKSISFQEDGMEGDPGFSGLFPGFDGYKLEFLGGDERDQRQIRQTDGESVFGNNGSCRRNFPAQGE
jgi:hypothetical protein